MAEGAAQGRQIHYPPIPNGIDYLRDVIDRLARRSGERANVRRGGRGEGKRGDGEGGASGRRRSGHDRTSVSAAART